MDVADVLRDRVQEPSGLRSMIVVSLGIHGLAIAAVFLSPGNWLGRSSQAPPTVMTIQLGGAGEGPLNGGMTAAGGRAVQVQTPPEEQPKREAVRPPAQKAPEMVLPEKNAKARASRNASTVVKQAPDDARGKTPTKGAQTTAGSAVANVGPRGQGFGLSTGGGPGSGSSLDVADFCCPDYLVTMVDRIRGAWNQNQDGRGLCIVKFTIQRSGQLSDITVEKTSGNQVLDLAAQRAVYTVKTLPPLPGAFPNPTLTVHLTFNYER